MQVKFLSDLMGVTFWEYHVKICLRSRCTGRWLWLSIPVTKRLHGITVLICRWHIISRWNNCILSSRVLFQLVLTAPTWLLRTPSPFPKSTPAMRHSDISMEHIWPGMSAGAIMTVSSSTYQSRHCVNRMQGASAHKQRLSWMVLRLLIFLE